MDIRFNPQRITDLRISVGTFLDLDRRFQEFTESELEDPEDLVSFTEYELPATFGWTEILAHTCVVPLAGGYPFHANSHSSATTRKRPVKAGGGRSAGFFRAQFFGLGRPQAAFA